jgi:hypothetical protein
MSKSQRVYFHARVSAGTAAKLNEIAIQLGHDYHGKPAPGRLLDAIASGKYHLWDAELQRFVYRQNE